MVGAPRFELGTPSPPDWCANRAALRSAAISTNLYADESAHARPSFLRATARGRWALRARSPGAGAPLRALWSDEKPTFYIIDKPGVRSNRRAQGAQIRSCSLDEAGRRGRIARGFAERPSASTALAQRADWKGPSRIAKLPSAPTLGREAGNSAANDYCR